MIELLILALILFSTLSFWVVIEQKKNLKFLFFYIPVLFILLVALIKTYISLLGQPIDAEPQVGLYLSHYVDEPEHIYMWILVRGKPISYRIPYVKQTHENMEDVGERHENGERMMLLEEGMIETDDGKKTKAGGENFTIGGDMSFYSWNFNLEKIMKKN